MTLCPRRSTTLHSWACICNKKITPDHSFHSSRNIFEYVTSHHPTQKFNLLSQYLLAPQRRMWIKSERHSNRFLSWSILFKLIELHRKYRYFCSPIAQNTQKSICGSQKLQRIFLLNNFYLTKEFQCFSFQTFRISYFWQNGHCDNIFPNVQQK